MRKGHYVPAVLGTIGAAFGAYVFKNSKDAETKNEMEDNNMDRIDIEDKIKLLEEAERTGEEVLIDCPVNNCEECPFSRYCK